MVRRRTILGASGVAIAGALAGCSDAYDLITEGEVRFDAEPVDVPDENLPTGYRGDGPDDRTIEEELADRQVIASIWVTQYQKELDVPDLDGLSEDLARWIGISVPQIEIAGQDVNPISDADPDEIIEQAQVQGQADEIPADLERDPDGDEEVETLGTTVTLEQFRGQPNWSQLDVPDIIAEADPDMIVLISEVVDHEDDHIIFAGAYPEVTEDIENIDRDEINDQLDERENLLSMIEAAQHPATE